MGKTIHKRRKEVMGIGKGLIPLEMI